MCRCVDLLEHADRDLRIHLRRLQVLVAEDRLDEADVRAAFVHERRHRVAEEMTRSYFPEIRLDHMRAHGPRQMIAAERLALRRQEHLAVVRFDDDLRTRLADVFIKPGDGALVDGNEAVFLAFAEPDEDRAAFQVYNRS